MRLKAYLPTPNDVYTIGYGHTQNVKKGNKITKEEAFELLLIDIEEAEDAVNKLVKVKLTQNQKEALISFVFNLGAGALKRSTLLKHLNNKDYAKASGQFTRWVYQGKTKLNGLVKRRKAEKAMFLSD